MTRRAEEILDRLILGQVDQAELSALRDLARNDAEIRNALADAEEIFASLALLPDPIGAPARGRARLLAAAGDAHRLERFAGAVASILGTPRAVALRLIHGIDRPSSWDPSPWPGIQLYHLEEGANVKGAIAGFVHMEPEVAFPHHAHLGEEVVLVLQGRYRDDDGTVVVPGDVVRRDSGVAHGLHALPGPSLIYLALVQTGIRIGDLELRAAESRM